MKTKLTKALENRRSYYAIGNESPISDNEIEEIIKFAVTNTPSAFNSQSTRIVLLLGDQHIKMWNIVKNTLRQIVSKEAFPETENKINNSFAAGYGTVLFFEDSEVVKSMQEEFPIYRDRFPTWSEHTSAMHQLVIWTMLEDAGFGASLQHYNPIIDTEVHLSWHLPDSWKLIAQMPFGLPMEKPKTKQFNSLNERIQIFK